MKKIIYILVLCFAYFFGAAQTHYTPVIANFTISGKPIGYSQATPADGRSMFYDQTNFLYRAYKDTQEVITYLNLPTWRAGNVVYIVDSGGTLNSNGTYTNFHATYWTFQDGVADVNLIKLFWNGNASGGCPGCFFTTTQLTDSSFKLNRPNGTSDTVVIDVFQGVYLNTANNFLTVTGTNVQAGGPLVQDTYANGGGHVFGITGNIFETGQGATLTAANVLTTGSDGNFFQVIGSTQINDITTTNRQGGTTVAFTFTGTPLLRNNLVGPAGSAPLALAGGVDYQAATGDYIAFQYDAVAGVWHETSRKLAGAVIPVTANNAITLSGANLQWGGTLVKNTTVAGNAFYTAFSGGRLEGPMGIPILAAGDLVTGNDGNIFHVTGTTQINAITTTNYQAGSQIGLVFDGIVTVKNNTVGGVNTAPMLLAGRVDYTSAVGDYMGFFYDGVNWYETERKLANGVVTVTASNGLTATGSNVTLGGNLTGNTTIAANTFTLSVSGSASATTLNVFNTSSGLAAQIQATSGEGAVISSLTNIALDADITPVSTNASSKAINIYRGTSGGTPLAGMGGQINMQLQSTTSIHDAAVIQWDWLDPANATASSQLDFGVATAGAPLAISFSINGKSTFLTSSRFEITKGATVASTGNLTLGTDGNVFHISGTTQINAITTANWQAGSEFMLIFDGSLTVKNNTAGGAGTAVMLLAGGADFSATSNDVLTLVWDGTSFFEKCRSVN